MPIAPSAIPHVEADAHSLTRYVRSLVRECEDAGARNWFYEKARKPTHAAVARLLPPGVPVTVIGDARVAGKSDAAIRDAMVTVGPAR